MLSTFQSEWLASARSRLLRRVAIAQRTSILDLGAGYGIVSHELLKRSGSRVTAFDSCHEIISNEFRQIADAALDGVCGFAESLPFKENSFDLVFSQCALMWMRLEDVISEIQRVLTSDGVFVAVEPDYSGMIEYPESIATRDLWIAGLLRAGADPFVGSKAVVMLHQLGFSCTVDLLQRLHPPSSERFNLLRGLPLTDKEVLKLREIEEHDAALHDTCDKVVHLPFFLIQAAAEPRR